MDRHRPVHRRLAQLVLRGRAPARLHREGRQRPHHARLLHQPLRGPQQPAAHLHGSGHPDLLHAVLRLRRRGGCPPLREHVRHALQRRPLGRRPVHHRLRLHRRLPGRQLDRHHPGITDDRRADPRPADGHLQPGRCHREHPARRTDQARCHQPDGRPRHPGHPLAGRLGSGLLRPAAHPRALHGRRIAPHHPQRPPHRHDLDVPVPVRLGRRRLLRHRLLRQPPRNPQHRGRQQRDRLRRDLAAAVQPLDRRPAAGRHPGCRHEHPVLPAARLLQRPHPGPLQDLPAPRRLRP